MNYDHPFIQKEAGRVAYKKMLMERVLPVGAMAGAAVGVPLLVSGAIEGVKGVRKAHSIEDSYKQMFEQNPTLSALREEGDEDRIRKHFEVLKTFAPDIAANPTAASSMVQSMIEQSNSAGAVSPVAIQMPIDMQAKIRNPAQNQVPWLVAATTGAMSGLKAGLGPVAPWVVE